MQFTQLNTTERKAKQKNLFNAVNLSDKVEAAT